MENERYDFWNNGNRYDFMSVGRKGRIHKVVMFDPFPNTTTMYNLAFGDWMTQQHKLNDFAISDNGDRQKVLATVAATVVDFLEKHPNSSVIAIGSTQSRNRLYRMGINANLPFIAALYELKGFSNAEWYPYKISGDYSALLLTHKN